MTSTFSEDLFRQYIHQSRYARWIPEKNRRETWEETVARYFDFFEEHLKENNNYVVSKDLRARLEKAVLEQEVMPSMRALMTAGPALKRSNIAGYNCAATPIDKPTAFDEILLILLNGVGMGFSVESKYIDKLPKIAEEFTKTNTVIEIEDSKEGWARGLRQLISLLIGGQIPSWDVSKVRPAGTPLKTFGGRASGPEPLIRLFQYTVDMFKRNAGKKLSTLDCHDLVCMIASTVVVGGVRRCLPEGTLIHTDAGLIKIENITPNMMVQSSNNTFQKVLATECVGIKKTITIKTNAGEFTCTPEHRMAIITNIDTGEYKWIEAKNLTNTDQLMFSSIGISGVDTTVPDFKYTFHNNSTTCKDINIKNLSTSQWAWLIGYLHGDGYIYLTSDYGSVTFAVALDMPETAEKIKTYISKLGVVPKIAWDGAEKQKDKCLKIRITSKQLATYLSQFKLPNEILVIPNFVLTGNTETRLAYLAGVLDSDGSLKSKRIGRKTFCANVTVYKDFAKSLRNLYASLGIPTKLRVQKSKIVEWQDKFETKVVGIEYKDKIAKLMMPFSEKVTNDYNFAKNTKEQYSFIVEPHLLKKSNRKKLFDSAYTSTSKCSWKRFCIGTEWFIPISIKSVEASEKMECYDIQVENTECFIAEGFLTHNSALISLSDMNDDLMRTAKSGNWWTEHPYRAISNNSYVANEQPNIGIFMKEWLSLYESRSGERGIFSRLASKKQAEKTGRRDFNHEFLVNPCSEVILRHKEFCNLTEVVIRENDTEKTLTEKVEIASIIGTWQSTLTNFKYISSQWKKNCEEERLLGVSLTGIYDNPLTYTRGETLNKLLTNLKNTAVTTNKTHAALININQSVSVTLCKPSGTVSALVNSSSGIHPRHGKFIIRTARSDRRDPLAQFMIANGFPYEDDVMNPESTVVFSFPLRSPENSKLRKDVSAIDHLELWQDYQDYWCEHKPSVTVSVKEHEWLTVGNWVYQNYEKISGVSFLPFSDHIYKQAPFQEVSEEELMSLESKIPKNIDWSKLTDFEKYDTTISSQEMACSGNSCDIIDTKTSTKINELENATKNWPKLPDKFKS